MIGQFTLKHNILSKKAEELNINNFPGVDEQKDSCLSFDYIFNNLNLLHKNCITPLMQAFGGHIAITSAYRCIDLNRALNGNSNSQHIRGQAVDIVSLKYPSHLIWNWCFQNLPTFNQLIWEYPERGDYTSNGIDFSWVHISWVSNNNPRTTSLSTTREDVHEMYHSENSTRIGDYTHNIVIADYNLI